ncbi:MAG: hypothetical protein M3Y70_03520 [Pseudomonadota bacterium]|nr:hypothetical protein [Pseudomonadota bacterium]
MFTSAELIEALRRRARRSLRPESAPGEYPPGWRAWFAAMRERVGAITGASADALVAILAARPLRHPPRRSPQLNRFQAFSMLWRQQWQPAGEDERWLRIVAFAVSAFMQLVFAIFVLWLAYARYGGAPPVPPGEDVVQVEFIGEGTPEEQGGGEPEGPRPDPEPARSAAAGAPAQAPSSAAPATQPEPQPQPPAPAAAPVAVTVPVPQPDVPTPPEPLPDPEPVPPTVAPQPLQTTDVVEPDIELVVPPPSPMRAVEIPRAQVEVPRLRAQVQALPSPVPAPRLPSAAIRDVPVQSAQVRVPGLQREVQALPSPGPPLPGVQARSAEIGQAQVSVPGLTRSVQSLPSPASSPAPAPGEGMAAGNTGAAPAGGAGETSAAGAAIPGAGAGPEKSAQAGAWSTLTAGDDWGESDRSRDGGQRGAPGLFDEEGRPRLPPGAGASVGGGLPPGMITEEIPDLDRAGTWLKRPPIDYTPTAFDRYWMPGGTLLEEWVRRGVREVQIAIPGTSKKIHCVVSLLQLGGGCGINDPDMQDQEAEARPPPEVPWKPELQER